MCTYIYLCVRVSERDESEWNVIGENLASGIGGGHARRDNGVAGCFVLFCTGEPGKQDVWEEV